MRGRKNRRSESGPAPDVLWKQLELLDRSRRGAEAQSDDMLVTLTADSLPLTDLSSPCSTGSLTSGDELPVEKKNKYEYKIDQELADAAA